MEFNMKVKHPVAFNITIIGALLTVAWGRELVPFDDYYAETGHSKVDASTAQRRKPSTYDTI